MDPTALTAGIFQPLPRQPHLETRFLSLLMGKGAGAAIYSPWDHPLQGAALLHSWTVHYPPPEAARQILTLYLEAWVESPWDSGALFFIPRVLMAFWHGLSKHVQELGTVPAAHLSPALLLPIPVVVLTIPPFRPSLRPSPTRMDPVRVPFHVARTHHGAADALRSLPPAAVAPGY